MEKRFLIFFVAVLFLTNVNAIAGITPPIYEINFQSGLKQTFTFTILTDNPENEFDLYLEGDLSEYAKLSSDRIKGATPVDVDLQLPESYNVPGKHILYFVVNEHLSPEKQNSGAIVVKLSLRGWIVVNVPYPGQYAEMEFSTKDANAGEPVNMNLKIYSRGDEDINTHSRIEIYQSGKLGENVSEEPKLSPIDLLLSPGRTVSGKYVESIDLGEDTIPSGQFQEINAKLDTTNYQSGIYKAVAVVTQSDQNIREERSFKLGELFVDISDYSNEFERDKIDTIIIELESFWNDKIKNVYVTGEILGTNINFKTPSIEVLQPFEKQRVEQSFDTTGIQGDTFQAKLTVHYEGKTTEKTVNLHFIRNTDYLLITLIVVLVLAAAFFIFVVIDFLILRRRHGEKKSN